MVSTLFRFTAVLFLLVAACAPAAAGAASATRPSPPGAATVFPTSTPVVHPSPSPKAPAGSPAPPANRLVGFAGLRSGVYPVHLHSRCDGSQQFHIVVLRNLTVGSSGSGDVEVPRGYFGRGLCVIVYGSPRLATVIATRTI